MFSSFRIEGFRGFREFEMTGLGRVNLLVGPNNGGKTSVLEALHILCTAWDPKVIQTQLARRGETTFDPSKDIVGEVDVTHFFLGHQLVDGRRIRLTGVRTDGDARRLEVRVADRPDGSGPMLEVDLNGTAIVMQPPQSAPRNLPRGRFFETRQEFVPTQAIPASDLARLWSGIALSSKEESVLAALRFVEPDVERISVVVESVPPIRPAKGGFIVRLRGHDTPIPIGSLGDGAWRLLGLAMSLAQCENGFLFVDDIDSGLHYSVMSKMWKSVLETAKLLNVQVFATTHSFDCVYSLAYLCRDSVPGEVSIQRIEKGSPCSVPYDEEELAVAAKHEIEVR